MPDKPISIKEHATNYIDHGLVVVPARNKRPFSSGWQNITLDEALDIDGWRNANGLNLLTGERSGVIALDVDIIKEDNPDLFSEVMQLMPPIYSGRLGNPKKEPTRFFQYNGEQARKFNAIQVEILSDGNNCCMPPGWNHQSRTRFQWVGKSLLDIDIDDLPPLEPRIVELLEDMDSKHKEKNKAAATTNGGGDRELVHADGRCAHNSHNVLSALGVALAHKEYPFRLMVDRLLERDRQINRHSDYLYFLCLTRKWGSDKARTNAEAFVDDIFRNYGPGGKKVEVNKPTVDTCGLPKREFQDLMNAHSAGFYTVKETKSGVIDVPLYTPLAKYWSSIMHFKCDDSYFALYEDDHYKYITKNNIKNIISEQAERRLKPAHLDNFLKMMTAKCFADKDSMGSKTGLVNLKNGVLNIDTSELSSHSHEYNFTYKLNHEFDVDAECPHFLKFLNYVFEGDKQLIDLIGEIIGYTLLGGYPFKHKAFMFFGSGRNGKSTLLDVITELLGRSNVSSVSMKLIDKPFSAVRLDGKLANIVEESPSNIDAEAFKNITSGGTVSAAKKGMDEFDLQVQCRVFFACNDYPHFKDSTKGNRERLTIVPFNRFIPEAERDSTIKGKLSSEMPGILNFALAGLARLRANDNQFTKSVAVDEKLKDYVRSTDSVFEWLGENVELTDNEYDAVSTRDLYARYRLDAVADGYHPVNKNTFSKRVLSGLGEARYDKHAATRNIRGYKKCKLRTWL